MKIEDAKRLYAIGGESKDIALIYFSEDQLKERTLPKTWEEYEIGKVGLITHCPIPYGAYSAFYALAKLYLLKQEYNGDWVADWKDVHQNKWVIFLIRDEWKKESYYTTNYFLAFKSPELRDQFAAKFKELIVAAKPLLG